MLHGQSTHNCVHCRVANLSVLRATTQSKPYGQSFCRPNRTVHAESPTNQTRDKVSEYLRPSLSKSENLKLYSATTNFYTLFFFFFFLLRSAASLYYAGTKTCRVLKSLYFAATKYLQSSAQSCITRGQKLVEFCKVVLCSDKILAELCTILYYAGTKACRVLHKL